jgi:phosphatidylglycerol lysyltransferase
MPAIDAERWIRNFADGDLIAASALQPGLQWFSTSFGVLPYRRVAGIDVTLGGPLCELRDRPELLRRFLSWSRRPILFYLREPTLALLEGSGLHAVGIGIDRHVDLEALLHDPSKPVRGALRHARRAELELLPLELERIDAHTRTRLEQITARYLAHAAVGREMAFLNRPMSYEPDRLRRVFALVERDRGMFGYAVLNPIFAAGQRRGWLLDILRFEPTKLWGVWFSSVFMLAQLLAAEGNGEALSLGFAPLHRVRPAPHARSRVLAAQVDWMVRYLSTTSYLARLRELKDEIPGPEEPRYLASYTRSLPTVLYAFLEAMGVDIRGLFGPGLIEVLREGWQLNHKSAWPRTPTSTLD